MFAGLMFFSFIVLGFWVYFLHTKRNADLTNSLSRMNKIISTHDDVRKILLAGMYQRFKKEEGKTEDTPIHFEHFVAKVMREVRGGETEVTQPSNDGGIDIYLYENGEFLLGQVKCHAPNNPVDYVPIAVLHSQMVKKQAKGGFLVTTSYYNDGAKEYAEGLDIELIDGEMFLDMWIQSVKSVEEESLNEAI